MWEFEGHTYHVLPDHGYFSMLYTDGPTLEFYVDESGTFIEEQAFTRYVFVWSEEFGLIGWVSGIHGCAISTAELMKLPSHDYRRACILRGFVVARGAEDCLPITRVSSMVYDLLGRRRLSPGR